MRAGSSSCRTVSAGGVVPAFEATLPYPLLLLLTQPTLAEGSDTLYAPRARDLTLSWDRGAPDVLFQVQTSSSLEGSSLICSELSEMGSMVLPAAALSALPSGTPFHAFTIGRVVVTAGDYDVFVVAAGAVTTPDRTRRIELVLE
jgi:hypothetical protein